MENYSFQYLCYLAGITEEAANIAGYCRAELINLLTGAYQPQN